VDRLYFLDLFYSKSSINFDKKKDKELE